MDTSKVHLWIGKVKKKDSEYLKYFELDYTTEGDFDDPKYKTCGFCRDIGVRWYDEDFIGIIPLFKYDLPIDKILEEAAVDEDEHQKIKEICKKLGIDKANAILWYGDGDLVLSKPLREEYNGLKYIGIFEGD